MVAAVRHGLYDFGLSVNTVVGRVLVYAALGAVVAVTYGALNRVVHRVAPPATNSWPRWHRPRRRRPRWDEAPHPGFQRRIDRFLYRKRDDDYAVLASPGRGCGRRSGPDSRSAGHRRNGGIGVGVAHVNLTVGRGDEVAASATYGAVGATTSTQPKP